MILYVPSFGSSFRTVIRASLVPIDWGSKVIEKAAFWPGGIVVELGASAGSIL